MNNNLMAFQGPYTSTNSGGTVKVTDRNSNVVRPGAVVTARPDPRPSTDGHAKLAENQSLEHFSLEAKSPRVYGLSTFYGPTTFSARQNLQATLDYDTSATAHELALAEAAIKRMETRRGEDLDAWASALAADFVAHRD